MKRISINGGEPRIYYESWAEVCLADTLDACQHEDPLWHLSRLDCELLGLAPLPPIAYKPVTVDVALQPFGKYALALLHLQAKNFHAATQVYFPKAADNGTAIGEAMAVLAGVAAFQSEWSWLNSLEIGPKASHADKLQGYGLLPILVDLSGGNPQQMKLNELEPAGFIMQVYGCQQMRAHVSWLNSPANPINKNKK